MFIYTLTQQRHLISFESTIKLHNICTYLHPSILYYILLVAKLLYKFFCLYIYKSVQLISCNIYLSFNKSIQYYQNLNCNLTLQYKYLHPSIICNYQWPFSCIFRYIYLYFDFIKIFKTIHSNIPFNSILHISFQNYLLNYQQCFHLHFDLIKAFDTIRLYQLDHIYLIQFLIKLFKNQECWFQIWNNDLVNIFVQNKFIQ